MANSVTGFSVLVTLSFQHSIFSDKCTSSSLDCPYNIDQSVQQLKGTTLASSSPTYEPTPAVYNTSLSIHETTSTVHNQVTTKQPVSPPMNISESTKQETGKWNIWNTFVHVLAEIVTN
jgi:hypothetical protein